MATSRSLSRGSLSQANQNRSRSSAAAKDAAAPPAHLAVPDVQLHEAGLTRGADGGYQLSDTFRFRQHMERTMRRAEEKERLLQRLADSWENEDGLRQALLPMRTPSAGSSAGEGVKDSLVRMLLHVNPLQNAVAKMLLERLGECQADMDTADGMPLSRLIVNQFRWLEHIVDGDALVETVSECMQALEPPLQRELILVLPDLVQDGQHQVAVDLLSELLQQDSQFTAPVLDSLGSLQLNPEMIQQVSEMITAHVESSNPSDLPLVIRFLLQNMTSETAAATVASLRKGLGLDSLDGGASSPQKGEPDAKTLVLDALQSALRLRKDLTGLVLAQMQSAKDYRPVDWWLVCALYSTSVARDKQKVAKLVASKAAKLLLTAGLLRSAVVTHGAALRPHYSTQLELAGALVRASDATARALGRSLYVMLLEEFGESYDRQELLGCLLTHVGSGNEPEVDGALHALVQLATDHTGVLAQFAAFLTGVLDYLDALTLSQARQVFELFARLACDSAEASRLPDELAIIIRKQLSNPNVKYKRLGVLGGCSLLSRLGARRKGDGSVIRPRELLSRFEQAEAAGETEVAETSVSDGSSVVVLPMDPARLREAQEMLDLMLKFATAADGSKGFLLRELSRMVAARRSPVSREITDMLAEKVTAKFEQDYLSDTEQVSLQAPMVHGLRQHLTLGLDQEADIALNLLPLLKTADCPVAQRHLLSTLSSTFELLSVCEAACSDTGDSLEAVDAVLGCPIIFFSPAHLKDFNALNDGARSAACLALFYAVDWLRELVNAFASQQDPLMRSKVVQRLHQLRWLEIELDRCLALTPDFRLPGDTGALSKPAAKPRAAAAAAAKKPAAKKQKKRVASEVDSSENEDAATDDEAAPAHEAAPPPAAGKGKAKASDSGASKPRGKPAAAGAHFARLSSQLRPLSLDTSLILTYAGAGVEGQDGEGAEHLKPAAVHYLLVQLHATLKASLASPSRIGRPAKSDKSEGDDAAGDLRGLSGAALLQQIGPALLSFRDHTQTLLEMLPQLQLPPRVDNEEYRPRLDAIASFSGEPDDYHRPHVQPSLLLILRCVHLLVASPQLADAESEGLLLRLLAHLGELPPPPSGPLSSEYAAEACAAAFDFFLALRPEVPSLGAANEVVGLERAILVLQARVAGGAQRVPEAHVRREQLATLAHSILADPPLEKAEDGKEKPQSQALIGRLFECHASYTDSPQDLLVTWTEELLPELEGAPEAAVEEQPLLKRGTVASFLKVLFPLLIRQTKQLELPDYARKLKPKEKKEGKIRYEEPDVAREHIVSLQQLTTAFVQLVSTTKFFEADAVFSVAMKAAAEFLTLFNARALPFLAAHFMQLHEEAMSLLKHIQPATRLLQIHCSTVKQRMITSAVGHIPKLKRQLEELIYTVKVMLKDAGCPDSFWMGNLKHKNLEGHEVSSQLQVQKREKKKPEKKPKKAAASSKGKGKKRKQEEEDSEAEEADEADEADDETEPPAGHDTDAESEPDPDAIPETIEEDEMDDETNQDEYPASMLGSDDDEGVD